MFLQLRLIIILLVFVSCSVFKFDGYLSAEEIQRVTGSCGPEEGLVQIGITGSGKAWFYEWSAYGLKLTGKRRKEFSPVSAAPPGGVYYHGKWDEKATGLSQNFLGSDLRLDAPFAVSPGGLLLVSSVYPPKGELFLSQSSKLALIDRKNRRLIITFDAWCDVDSVTWAPSGKYFAVLLSQDVTKGVWKGPLDWVASLAGHPISYYTLYVATYDLQGKLLCQKRINEKLRIGRGYLVWEAVSRINVEGKNNRNK